MRTGAGTVVFAKDIRDVLFWREEKKSVVPQKDPRRFGAMPPPVSGEEVEKSIPSFLILEAPERSIYISIVTHKLVNS